MTSRVKRAALGIHEPLYGWLTSGMIAPYGDPLPLDRLIHPIAEPEIAFLTGDRLEAPATVATVLAGTEAVFPAIDVADSRYRDRFGLPDSVADNAGAAWVAIGSRARRPCELEDLRLIGCVFRRGGEVIGTAAGGAAMGHPAAAVAWLFNSLAAQDKYLPAGSYVLSGGLTAAVPVRSRDVVCAEFDGQGSVEVFS